MGTRPIVLLAGPCQATNIVYHALVEAFGEVAVVEEAPVSRASLLRRRLKRLGPVTVAGQVLFSAFVVPVLTRRGRGRIAAIKTEHRLDASPVDAVVMNVPTVNTSAAREVLRQLQPAVVVVSGTRIIGHETLASVDAPFVNLHAGITPDYRGVHGGYWALAEGRPDMVGSTVHLVDAGIDTGRILGQARFTVTTADSFATYPYLHLAAGVPILTSAVEALLRGECPSAFAPGASARSVLRSHPTIGGYLATRFRRSVR